MYTKKNCKVYKYSDEINDDFAGTNVKKKKRIDGKYLYINNNLFFKVGKFLLYWVIAIPVVWIFCKIAFLTKVKNKKVLKKYKKTGYIMYGNHTGFTSDAFHPNIVNLPHRTYILVSEDAVSIKGVKTMVEMLGGIPVASDMVAGLNCYKAIKKRVVDENSVLMIYPEAHIWPYYVGVRNFVDHSFRYPVSLGVPTFCMTTVYKRRKFLPMIFKKPKIEVYIDGPFFPDSNLKPRETQKQLRDVIYEKMLERSKLSNYEYIKYVKIENENDSINLINNGEDVI